MERPAKPTLPASFGPPKRLTLMLTAEQASVAASLGGGFVNRGIRGLIEDRIATTPTLARNRLWRQRYLAEHPELLQYEVPLP